MCQQCELHIMVRRGLHGGQEALLHEICVGICVAQASDVILVVNGADLRNASRANPVCMCICICIYLCIYVCICVYMYEYVYVYVYTCICTWVPEVEKVRNQLKK